LDSPGVEKAVSYLLLRGFMIPLKDQLNLVELIFELLIPNGTNHRLPWYLKSLFYFLAQSDLIFVMEMKVILMMK
jgi:hypothetical protein